jgi:hypothetical protein
MMAATRAVAEDAGSGAGDPRASLLHLANALRTHNLREEALLKDIILSTDAWGAARAAIMTEAHVKEHARLCEALLEIPYAPVELARSAIAAVVDSIREHMDREEEAFLGEDVLRDDIVVANQSGG